MKEKNSGKLLDHFLFPIDISDPTTRLQCWFSEFGMQFNFVSQQLKIGDSLPDTGNLIVEEDYLLKSWHPPRMKPSEFKSQIAWN